MNISFGGYQEKTMEDIPFLKCPNCNNVGHSLTGRGDGIWECDICKHQDIREKFPIIRIMKAVLTCSKCQTKIHDTPSYGSRFFSCYECRNVVAVKYNKKFYQPTEIINTRFQSPESLKGLGRGINLVECRNLRTTLPLYLLEFLSHEEENGFLSFKSKYQNAILLYVHNECIGYLIWSFKKREHDGCPILRQVFIKKEHRKKGWGSLLIQTWYNIYVTSNGGKFGVENPNNITFKILINLEHITKDKNNLEYKDCFLIT
ncbi:GNAT family N-acetyltransferase [Methanobacterium petrolearium]|uniref:GNAT family N-acetyltransferase n=2 Tax=Methanobacterium petrolearium TaxID=710190 RepID=UPI001AE50B67|nr:GNAT family N-acetyltransferase [Methanobacterium petrolearium]